MTEQAFRALVGIEFRRSRDLFVRVGIIGAVAVVALIVLRVDVMMWGFVLSALGAAFVFQTPFEVAKDKLTGSLELLTTLPVTASVLAVARMTANVFFASISAACIAAAAGVALPAFLPETDRVRIALVSFLVSSIVLSAATGAAVGIVVRFKAKIVMSYGAFILVGAFFAGGYLYDRLFGSPVRAIQAIMASDHTLLIVTAAALGASTLVLTGSFLLARKGLERYEPEPDTMDW